MQKAYYIKIVFKNNDYNKVKTKDPILKIALKNDLSLKIIPDKYFTQMHALKSHLNINLSHYGLKTSVGILMPEQAYTEYQTNNKKLIQKFSNYKNDIISSYDNFEQFIKKSNENLINFVWNYLYPSGGKPSKNFIMETNQKIINLLPTKEKLYTSLNINISISKIINLNDENKILIQEMKINLINIITVAFNKIINFYNIKKQIRPNMLRSFLKEINRICLLCFCYNINNVVQTIQNMIREEEYKIDPNNFITKLIAIKKHLIEEVTNWQN